MVSLFIKEDDTFRIDFFIGQNKDGKQTISLKKEDVVSPESHFVIFRKPNYRDNVAIISSSVSSNFQQITVDPAKMRYERFVRLAKEWSFVNEDKEIIVPTRENIDKLSPMLADFIVEQLDDLVGLVE